jgi:hypothetical protein
MTDEQLTFGLRLDYNPILLVGQRRLDVIAQVTANGPGTVADNVAPRAAEVIIIDASKSMTGSRIAAARDAACAAVDALRESSYFAVVAGQTAAQLVFPPSAGMVEATGRNRAAAKRRIAKVTADGTTNISTWLRQADTLLAGCQAQIKHAIMLTDGKSTDAEGSLAATLNECEGRFTCDCRGIGDGWRDEELRQIANALFGTWKPVAAAEDLAGDFREALMASMEKRIANVVLRVSLHGETALNNLSQVAPSLEDLTGKGVAMARQHAVEFPLGPWGPQVRDYHLRLETSQQALQIENEGAARAARLEVIVPGRSQAAASASVGVSWTVDPVRPSEINPVVAGYTNRKELKAAVDAGLRAWREGRPDAEESMGRAVRLAYQLQDADLLERFSAIAELENPAAGLIRLRGYEQVSRADLLWASYFAEQSAHIKRDEGDG